MLHVSARDVPSCAGGGLQIRVRFQSQNRRFGVDVELGEKVRRGRERVVGMELDVGELIYKCNTFGRAWYGGDLAFEFFDELAGALLVLVGGRRIDLPALDRSLGLLVLLDRHDDLIYDTLAERMRGLFTNTYSSHWSP